MSSSVVDAEFISEQITADVAFKYAIILAIIGLNSQWKISLLAVYVF